MVPLRQFPTIVHKVAGQDEELQAGVGSQKMDFVLCWVLATGPMGGARWRRSFGRGRGATLY